jgi:(p)ppGpp synthase/HD superfamily hydrolase/energy-coupling factor transporter ATP-binding protein EcfA2
MFQEQVSDPVVVQHVQEIHNLLTLWQARTPVLLAAWLLVPIKNELISEHALITHFGNRALNLAKLANKIIFVDANPEHVRRNSSKATYTELTRRLFIYAYHDFEAILLVVADQLATAAQFDQMSETERLEWAQRNQTVFVPLLEMLGLWKHRSELGNISLYILNPAQYEQLDNQVRLYREKHQRVYDLVCPALEQLLKHHGLQNIEIGLHLTTPVNIARRIEKLKKRGESPKASDIGALCIDVLLEHEMDCYVALGAIHNHWKPALRHTNLNPLDSENESRFSDYIASPRYNGYRCLITTVLCDIEEKQQLVEFRLRTYQMEQINAYGVAAAILNPAPVRNVWWVNQTVRDLVKPGNTDFLRTDICVFTPTGEVIYPLRAGSTMVDLAFKIHSETGVYAKAFLVNGKPAGLDYEPRHRDLVEIEYDFAQPSVTPEWEDIARLPSTKTNIRRFLKLRDRAPHKGRQLIDEVLEREARVYRMRFLKEKMDSLLNKIAQSLHLKSLEALYMRVCEGVISPDEIVAAVIEAELVGHIALESGAEYPKERIRIAQTWMQEKESRKWERSSRVYPGVEIVGKFTGRDGHRTLTVYRKDSKFAPTGENAVPLRWRTSEDNREIVEVSVTAAARSHVIGMVFNAVYGVGKDSEQHRINIHRFNAEMQEGQLIISLLVDAASSTTLQLLQDALKTIQRSGFITEFKIWQLFPSHRNLLVSRSDKRPQNPYTFNQVGSRSMFYGRQDEIQKVLQNIEAGHLVVLYGQKRIGKTSLLKQLAETLLPQHGDFFPVLFDVQRLFPFDTRSFLSGLVEATISQLKRKELKFHKRSLSHEPFKAFAEWVNLVQQRMQGTRLVFLIDEFTRAEEEARRGTLDVSFFHGLQWLAGEQKISFILCVHDHIMSREGNKSWGLLQRGKAIRLDALDRPSAEKLVQQPLENHYKLEPDLVNRILQLTNCHPYLIHVLCHTLITYVSQENYDYVTSNDLERAVREIIVNGEHYFSHLIIRINKPDWEPLKMIAYLTDVDRDKGWVTSEEVRQSLQKFGYNSDRLYIARSINDLRNAGIIEAKESQTQAMYRLPIGLFHIWLKQVVTNLAVSRDLQGENP